MNNKLKIFSWYAFDMGNSAHALLISTIGFSLYFKEYLFKSKDTGDSVWGILTALVLIVSGVLSPLLSSWLFYKKKRAAGIIITTVVCVVATAMLSTRLSENIVFSIIIYFVSALGYYLALPVYNSYLPELSDIKMQKISGTGWALGYLGGILSAGICFKLGYLNISISERPDLYRNIFLIAALFNFIVSAPMLILSLFQKDIDSNLVTVKWNIKETLKIFKNNNGKGILNLLIIYWLIGEVAVIITYFFAIFLKEYAGLSPGDIIKYSIIGQFVAIISTWLAGFLSEKFGGKKILIFIVVIWCIVPFILFMVSIGISFWIAVFLISIVIGGYHSIIRAKIADIASQLLESTERGSLFGFLEVSGRFSQVIGPLLISIVTLLMPLNYGIITMMIFPVVALIMLLKYKW